MGRIIQTSSPTINASGTKIIYRETITTVKTKDISLSIPEIRQKIESITNALTATQQQKAKDIARHDETITHLQDQIQKLTDQITEAKRLGLKED